MIGCLDTPAPGQSCDPLSFRVEGWVRGPGPDDGLVAVEAWVDGRRAGSTREPYVRPDVDGAHGWTDARPTGFTLVARCPEGPFGAEATLVVVVVTKAARLELFRRPLRFIALDHRTIPHGKLLQPTPGTWLGHDDIFGWGPSQEIGSPEVLALLRRHLGPRPRRLVDVGCGLGSYARALIADGHAWHGVEIKPSDCDALEKAGLPHTRTDGGPLPFADGAFDAALVIEVLEHLPDPRAFLAEVKRVAPGRLLASVPNAELVTYLQPRRAVPWHMLESDHRNFFTQASLAELLGAFYPRVEVFGYDRMDVTGADGIPLPYALFAIASG